MFKIPFKGHCISLSERYTISEICYIIHASNYLEAVLAVCGVRNTLVIRNKKEFYSLDFSQNIKYCLGRLTKGIQRNC
jgi:hypothetical protein